MAIKRTRNIFDPKASEPFKLSRSKIEDFVRCPRCFYLDRRLGIGKPSMPGFTLNSAVDALLKKEFDGYRERAEAHPLMKEHGVEATPFQHPDLDIWRENFKGLQFLHEPTNLKITGAVDDIWVTPEGQLIVVDYKSASKDGVVSLEDEWKESYKRQMEIYQWLLRRLDFNVSEVGYFLYANGRKDFDLFDGMLRFHLQLLPYQGDDSWVEPKIFELRKCLDSDNMPAAAESCEYCTYRAAIREVE